MFEKLPKKLLPEKQKLSVFFQRLVLIVIGGACSALAVNLFFFPVNFLSGGLSGIALGLYSAAAGLWEAPTFSVPLRDADGL
ncbi:MAG: YitT family protein [Spirochaetia bacterium]